MQEPKDGDFVAYIEALQRESAARLIQQHLGVNDVAGASTSSGHSFEAPGKVQPATSPASNIARLVREDIGGRLVKASVAAVVGAVFLLNWLGNGRAFSFILAVVLLGYAVPRLLAAFRQAAVQPSNRAAIDHVFGRSGATAPATTKTGTKK